MLAAWDYWRTSEGVGACLEAYENESRIIFEGLALE